LERIAKVRNTTCHVPLVPNKKTGEFEFAPAAATKLLKSMTIRSKVDYAADRLPLQDVKEAIERGGKALGGGEDILVNFAKAAPNLKKSAELPGLRLVSR
jgi:hypothetical protein